MKFFAATISVEEEDQELWNATNPDAVVVSDSYSGPQLKFPLTTSQIDKLADAFRNKEVQDFSTDALHCSC